MLRRVNLMAKMKHPKMLLFPFEVASLAIQIVAFIKAEAILLGCMKPLSLDENGRPLESCLDYHGR